MTNLIDHLAELTGFRDRDQLDTSIVRAIHDVLGPQLVSIFRCVGEDGNRRWLTCARMAQHDAEASADPRWADILALPPIDAAPVRQACLASGASTSATTARLEEINCFPIATEHEVVGVLEMRTACPLSASDRTLVATVMRIYGNFHDLLDHCERDSLTGLLNRHTFNSALMVQPTRVPAAGDSLQPNRRDEPGASQVWLGVVDIDHFKRVNDRFGHPIGDEVLLLLSRLLRSSFRHFDRLYRFGGEEFVVVLACAKASEATMAFERLRTNVERFQFPQVGQVTVSIGFTRTTSADTPSTAFGRADKALYHVKDTGRNRVAQYDLLIEDGAIIENNVVGEVELF